ncbi:alpha/beta hydrolase [Marinobacterium zhoushanense]|uniref:Alpha/beta hydrolase n=1 Tax=Marinobacterium zhoushanense TaxID=1679163 RepID=A0ABQ1KSR6_9GAMM|nr:alpha/beta hydrolase [Marinobacterium zhoushanense]GGC05850.1 alpha/beta hydrolase [Marinobacterium zhoushanense]
MNKPPEYPTEQPATQDTRPWLLLRGLAREQRHWGEFPKLLAERMRARVICPDTPGNGYRCQEHSPLNIRDTLEAVRRELGNRGPLNLLGLSMGGMIATEWTRLYPQEVNTLVLINSSFGNFSPPWQRLRPRALGRVLASLTRPTLEREGVVFDLICQRSGDRRDSVAEWAKYAVEQPLSRANFARQLTAASRYRGPAKAPLPTTLILSGLGDRLVNPACSAAIARRWGVDFDSHPWAGHDLPHDDPQWVIQRLQVSLQDR